MLLNSKWEENAIVYDDRTIIFQEPYPCSSKTLIISTKKYFKMFASLPVNQKIISKSCKTADFDGIKAFDSVLFNILM